MPLPKPNTEIMIRKGGRARVTVGGEVMVGVTGVELRDNGDGYPAWFIRVSSRFVNCLPESVDGSEA